MHEIGNHQHPRCVIGYAILKLRLRIKLKQCVEWEKLYAGTIEYLFAGDNHEKELHHPARSLITIANRIWYQHAFRIDQPIVNPPAIDADAANSSSDVVSPTATCI